MYPPSQTQPRNRPYSETVGSTTARTQACGRLCFRRNRTMGASTIRRLETGRIPGSISHRSSSLGCDSRSFLCTEEITSGQMNVNRKNNIPPLPPPIFSVSEVPAQFTAVSWLKSFTPKEKSVFLFHSEDASGIRLGAMLLAKQVPQANVGVPGAGTRCNIRARSRT